MSSADKPRSRQGNRSRKRGRPPTLEQRADRILRDLRGLLGALADDLGHDPGASESIERLTLAVELPPSGRARRAAGAELLSSLRTLVGETIKARTAFRPGRVYCFRCESADCAHTAPGDLKQTFSGYTATGRPEWQSFVNLCIARGEARVDRLFGTSPAVIAFVQEAGELKGELMPGFGRGSMAFNVLGQVVAGLVPADLVGAGDEDRIALSLQVVESRSAEEGRAVRLNVLNITMDEIATAAAEGGARGRAEMLRRTLGATRRRLQAVSRRAQIAERRGQSDDLGEEVRPILSRLRSDIERIFNGGERRTNHAEERHRSAVRPTSNAIDDARRAADTSLMRDARRNTVIVLGPRNRAHVFSEDGRHVTSLQLDAGEVGRKTARARWRPLPPAEVAAFRRALDGHE